MSDGTNGYHQRRSNQNTDASFNPNAREFVPNPDAREFVPYKITPSNNDINARCGEVAEILQDVIGYNDGQDDEYDAHLNDDELLEMLEMQEECRREMMKTYVQANNPVMFEEIYHNVSYPDEAIIPQPPNNNNHHHQQHQHQTYTTNDNNHHQQQQQQQHNEVILDNLNNLNIKEQQPESATETVKKNLSPEAKAFVPKKYSELSKQ